MKRQGKTTRDRSMLANVGNRHELSSLLSVLQKPKLTGRTLASVLRKSRTTKCAKAIIKIKCYKHALYGDKHHGKKGKTTEIKRKTLSH